VTKQQRATQITHLLLRVVSGLLFFQAGMMKFGFYGSEKVVPFASQMGIGATIEVLGGILIMLGLFTRPVAFLCSGQMAVAYFQFHQPKGTWPLQNHGQQAVLLCFIFLFFVAVGAGDVSVDALLAKRRKTAAKKKT
jgi:putative oxidoreductase